MAWNEAITAGRRFDQERDTPRIRQAFLTLTTSRESWPQPKHFLDALPRVEQAALGYELKPATPEQAESALDEIRRVLRQTPPSNPSPVKAKRQGRPLVDVERELAEHYGKTAEQEPSA